MDKELKKNQMMITVETGERLVANIFDIEYVPRFEKEFVIYDGCHAADDGWHGDDGLQQR